MHEGVAAHRETHDRVKVSASPDVPLSEPAMAGSALVVTDGPTQTDLGRIPVATSATMTARRGPQAALEVLAAQAAEIGGPRVTTMMIMVILAGAMSETCALALLRGADRDAWSVSGQKSARLAASVLRNVARRGNRSSDAAQVVPGRGLARQRGADSGMTMPRRGGVAQAGQAAAIRARAAWAVDALMCVIHARRDVDRSPGRWSLSQRALAAGRRSSSYCSCSRLAQAAAMRYTR